MGNTDCKTTLRAREAGAKKVYFASGSPPITYVSLSFDLNHIIACSKAEVIRSHPHIYGIDLATSTELVAHERDRKSIAARINADDVIFQTLADLEASCAELSPRPDQCFEIGVFCGRYVTPVSPGYLENLEKTRGKPSAIGKNQNGEFVTVGDSVTAAPAVSERSDISLHNLADYDYDRK